MRSAVLVSVVIIYLHYLIFFCIFVIGLKGLVVTTVRRLPPVINQNPKNVVRNLDKIWKSEDVCKGTKMLIKR